MIKCNICGESFSDGVYKLHRKRCKVVKVDTSPREELKKLTVKELKDKCKELEVKGYSRKNEDELITMILEKVGG